MIFWAGRVFTQKGSSDAWRFCALGHVRHSLADITKAQRLLGYEPNWNVREGLEVALDWYIEQYR